MFKLLLNTEMRRAFCNFPNIVRNIRACEMKGLLEESGCLCVWRGRGEGVQRNFSSILSSRKSSRNLEDPRKTPGKCLENLWKTPGILP